MVLRIEGTEKEFADNPTYYEVAKELKQKNGHDILLVSENGRLRELHCKAKEGSEVRLITAVDLVGFETYRRSAVMLFQAALRNVFQDDAADALVHFSVGNGFYLTIQGLSSCDTELCLKIETEMHRLSELGLPFSKKSVRTANAVRLFHDRGMPDKEKLFRTRIASRVNVYSLDSFSDYYYGFMAYDSSYIRWFELFPYAEGLILNLPGRSDPEHVRPMNISGKLFQAQQLGGKWAVQQGIGTVGDLNSLIIAGNVEQTVLTAEAFQEGRIARIADMIEERKDVKFVMIAGPSSSGKTTFAQRLCTQLMTHGLNPHYVGVDNYFRNREDMKPGPDGRIDFEGLHAVDVNQFNDDMMALLLGETLRMPKFDFIEGKRYYDGEKITLREGDLLVIEGIHCLNDELSITLPAASKFRIYISALTQLNVDGHNRIPSTDGRLLRRIVRDNRTRGYPAAKTLGMWDMVRAGEERNIFPYQENADVMFNSALPYEIAALKTYVMPLLFQITEEDPSYLEAKRLLKFLDYFLPIPSERIPMNSILREFIGGGCFHL